MESYELSEEQVMRSFNTSEYGLSSEEAKSRLERYGKNEIKRVQKISRLKIFINQFKSFIIYILIFAFLFSLIIGIIDHSSSELIDAAVIFTILILNAVIGYFQEYRAEQSIEALKKLASLKAKVMRDREKIEIEASELVPGDIIYIEEGDRIPADARLLKIISLQTMEASLTGESTPVSKQLATLKNKQIADRTNMVFSGTTATKGRGQAVVTGTGMQTQLGKIAKFIQEEEKLETPLQIKLKQLGKLLSILVLVISLIIFGAGVLAGNPVKMMILAAITIAVAAVPEGLPAVVTVSLALGVKRMVKRKALIRKLPSVETLGSTTVICSDKTGTLTHNQMTVQKLFVNNKVIDVTGAGYNSEGDFFHQGKPANLEDLDVLLRIGLLCNNAKVDGGKVIGDPTEGALIVSANKAGYIKKSLKVIFPRTHELPFDSQRKMMSTVHDDKGKPILLSKGAPDIILERCSYILINGKEQKLTKDLRSQILRQNEAFARQALRVLGHAYRYPAAKEMQEPMQIHEDNLVFVGLQAMMDPPRAEVRDAIAKCRSAGIKVVMITGDHLTTAYAIGKSLGIEGKSMTGAELAKIKNLEDYVEDIAIYARVNPEHKMKIVKALQHHGHIVAMTGDGVNDAPALKKSNIGIAMGITGTDVSKEASDMILTDDNFTSIVNAVEEGRGIFTNIRKFVQYLLSSNFGEVLVLFMGTILGFLFMGQLPILPTQILWMNLLTDGLPAVALSVDPMNKSVMSEKPRKIKEGVLNKKGYLSIFITGILICVGTLFLFWLYIGEDIVKARTVAFTTLVIFQIVRLQVIRMDYKSGFWSNKWLIGAVIISVLLQVLIIYTPLNVIFKTTPIGLLEWVYIIAVAMSAFVINIIFNYFMNLSEKRKLQQK